LISEDIAIVPRSDGVDHFGSQEDSLTPVFLVPKKLIGATVGSADHEKGLQFDGIGRNLEPDGDRVPRFDSEKLRHGPAIPESTGFELIFPGVGNGKEEKPLLVGTRGHQTLLAQEQSHVPARNRLLGLQVYEMTTDGLRSPG
jgi:hypothetical protein